MGTIQRCASGLAGAVAIFASIAFLSLAALATAIDDSVQHGTMGGWTYSGGWAHVRQVADGRSQGTSTRSATAGAAAILTFHGASVLRFYGVRGPAGGLATVRVDHEAPRTMNFYAHHVTPHALMMTVSGLPKGEHTVAFIVQGSRIGQSFGKYVNIDGVELDPATPPAVARVALPVVRPHAAVATALGPAKLAHAQHPAPHPFASAVHHATVVKHAPVLLAQHRPLPQQYSAPQNSTAQQATTSEPIAHSQAGRVHETPAATLKHLAMAVLPSSSSNWDLNLARIFLVAIVALVVMRLISTVRSKRTASRWYDLPITWTNRLGVEGSVDEAARRQLLRSIAEGEVEADEQTFMSAFIQEHSAGMRLAVLRAIRDGGSPQARSTLQRATADWDERVRTLAAEALARIGDLEAVETLLGDRSYGVALAAAYQLAQAYGIVAATRLVFERTAMDRSAQIVDTLKVLS